MLIYKNDLEGDKNIYPANESKTSQCSRFEGLSKKYSPAFHSPILFLNQLMELQDEIVSFNSFDELFCNLQNFVVMKMSFRVSLCFERRSLKAFPRTSSLLYKCAESNRR